jgi:DNA-directed RNA polymerase subunit K/omega
MNENPTRTPEENADELAAATAAELKDTGPQVPSPFDRPPDVDRKIRSAVSSMLETVQDPYEVVIVAAQEARRLNEKRIKARSILNQTAEPIEELVPEVPFVPRPVEDDEPEVKATNEALERLALGIVEYEADGAVVVAPSFYAGEIDFPLYPDEDNPDDASGA